MTVLHKVKAFFKRPKPEVKGAETKGVEQPETKAAEAPETKVAEAPGR